MPSPCNIKIALLDIIVLDIITIFTVPCSRDEIEAEPSETTSAYASNEPIAIS